VEQAVSLLDEATQTLARAASGSDAQELHHAVAGFDSARQAGGAIQTTLERREVPRQSRPRGRRPRRRSRRRGRSAPSAVAEATSGDWTCTIYDARDRIPQKVFPANPTAGSRTVNYNYAVNGDWTQFGLKRLGDYEPPSRAALLLNHPDHDRVDHLRVGLDFHRATAIELHNESEEPAEGRVRREHHPELGVGRRPPGAAGIARGGQGTEQSLPRTSHLGGNHYSQRRMPPRPRTRRRTP
jgi:hypothetical protein